MIRAKSSCSIPVAVKSDTFRVGAARRLQREIADCELATIADAGHFVPMEKPQECARVIAEFLYRKHVGPNKQAFF